MRAKLRAIGYSDAEIDSRDDLNPATVAYYRELGYLPAAIVNYLGRLGWSLDDKTEFIPLADMIANFSLERVQSGPASFDPVKLDWLAGEYMKLVSLDEKVAGCQPYLVRAGLLSEPVSEDNRQRLYQVVSACGDRIKVFSDILTYAPPFFRTNPDYDPKAVEKRLRRAGAVDILAAFADVLRTAEPFDAPTLERALQEFCAARGCKPAELVHPVRVATTGVEVGIGLFETLAILGREEVQRRIHSAMKLT